MFSLCVSVCVCVFSSFPPTIHQSCECECEQLSAPAPHLSKIFFQTLFYIYIFVEIKLLNRFRSKIIFLKLVLFLI